MSTSSVSCEASRDLWRSIGPSTTVVFKLRRPLSANKTTDLNSKFRAKRPVYLRHMSRRDSRNGCFWRKTADLHTSGGKRAEPWPAEVKSDESWQSAWRWRRGVRGREGRRTSDEARHSRRRPPVLTSKRHKSGRKYKGHLDCHKMYSTNYIYDPTDTRVLYRRP